MKRKKGQTCSSPRKKPRKTHEESQAHSSPLTQYSVLASCYANVRLLGDLLHEWLPAASRARRKRLRQFDTDFPLHAGALGKIIVGCSTRLRLDAQLARRDELLRFTQTQRATRGDSHVPIVCNIGEIIDFAIWTLFRRNSNATRTPSHMLCHGLQRAVSLNEHFGQCQASHIPGIVQRNQNPNVNLLKRSPWTDIANILGADAEMIMLSLLLDCALFQRLETGKDNLYQLSGEPMTCYTPPVDNAAANAELKLGEQRPGKAKGPACITLVRNRMYHARPSLNSQGGVQLGLKHIHILNRCKVLADVAQDVRIMQYVFPRQFGLHNVFTSKPDPRETTQPLKDYTMREDEISRLDRRKVAKIPCRLRGAAATLVRKLRSNHRNCSYVQLLRHYCPIPTPGAQPTPHIFENFQATNLSTQLLTTQLETRPVGSAAGASAEFACTTSLLPYATPIPQVIAFCQATVSRVLPRNALGNGLEADQNWRKLERSVEQFVRMRRFESFTLHEVCQSMKIKHVDWLQVPSVPRGRNLSLSDRLKRIEIFQELMYYIFDSLLVPLIQSNFYVTETGIHRYRLYYFRHDVWKKMADPSLATMRLSMFEPLNRRQIKYMCDVNNLGNSQMRLMPKMHGVRPITNLRRKTTRVVNGRQVLGPSINAQLAPIFSLLNMERWRQPEKQASAMFSVTEILDKLSRFKSKLGQPSLKPLYFVKVDIRSAFDTIPQDEMVSFINNLLLDQRYHVGKHVETKRITTTRDGFTGRLVSRFVSRGLPAEENPLLTPQVAAQLAVHRRRHVFIGTEQEKTIRIGRVREMLTDHLKNHVVRIGRKHFKQIQGIPQGSVLSSLLCNLFYSAFEREELNFLDPDTSLLLRLIDDFLLITTDDKQAKQFLEVMSRENVKYGIMVNVEKSLVNFEVCVDGHKIPRLHGVEAFPYCGMTIHTRDLQVCKDREPRDGHVQNGLTVSRSGRIGTILHTKVVSSLKRQMQTVLLDGSLNTRTQVMKSLFECFVETAMKIHQYLKNLPRDQRPTPDFMIQLCTRLIDAGFKMFHNAHVHQATPLTRLQLTWLASVALSGVLTRKQSGYLEVLHWLRAVGVEARRSMNMSGPDLGRMVNDCMRPFAKYVY